jgi:serine/threonine protein kinase
VLWEGDEKFVAPEVLNGGKIDARCDVYSLGRFLAWLYESAGLPLELKSVVAKATDEDPSKRYSSVTDFYKAIVTRQVLRRSVITGIAAVVIALSIVGAYFYMLPSPDDVEFVKPVEEPIPDDLMDDDPTLFGLGADLDSAAIDSIVRMRTQQNDSVRVDDRKMREYQAKAEQIFRKQFQREADAILSKIYNKDKMNLSEKDFMVRSKSVTEELAKKEAELAKAANLGNEKSQRIASEIIDQLTTKKMKELDKDYLGIRKKQAEEDNKTTNTTEKK